MKTKIFTLLLALAASVGTLFASNTKVGDIWYDFNSSTQTASVTYRGSDYNSYDNEYSGSVVIPSSVTYSGKIYRVTSIGANAFSGCSGLTSITIGNSVTSIGSSAFRGCSGLTTVTIPNSVTSIGDGAFYNCSGLTSITIGNSVTSIAEGTFFNCGGLTHVDIPNSVKSIGNEAFFNCIGLTYVTIPNSVKSIGGGAFFECKGLNSIEIPNSVKSIGNSAFHDCSGLTSITIGNSVTSIGNSAFYDCSGLTSVTIPNSVKSIGDGAFSNCSGLTYVAIPNSVTSIGSSAFNGCSGLTSIVVEDGNVVYDSRNDCNAIIKTATNTLIAGCQNTIIPNSVTSIGDNAFNGCSGLTSIEIPNSVTSIGDWAFQNCSGLTSVTIPISVTSIGKSAFEYCSSLTSFEIPNSITSIAEGTFFKCSGLTSVTIPISVKSIGDGAFAYCSSLISVTIGNSVTSIGMSAFYDCSGLTYVTIPNNVTSIGSSAFRGCSGLTTVTIEAETPPTLGSSIENVFDSRYLTSIYVPCGTSETYRTAAGWSSYASKIKEQSLPYAITTNALNGTISIDSICLDITLTAIPNEGYYFTQWSDGNKDNPRSFVLTQDTTFTAEFSNQYSINITCNEEYGTIIGENGTFEYLSEHTYEAVPNSGYHFSQWSDGNKDNPRTIILTQDTSLTAEFSKQYSIHVSCNEEQGSINGENGMFDYLSEHTYEAVPNSGYYFVKWSDGNKDNPRTIVLTQDTSLTAIFDILYNVSVLSDDPAMGSASFSDLLETQSLNYGQYPIGTNLIAKATPNQGYKFSHWSDGLSANPRGITVQSDINLIAYFELEQNSYTVTVSSANSSMGTVSGGGTYEEGQTATVTATPKSGYKFTRWSNGSTANPYSFTVTSDVSLTAYFEQSTTPQSESKFWNISDAAFNSLGTITSQTTINGLTIHATANKPIVVDADAREINGYSFTHRLKFGGTGASNARMLSFRVDGDCDIDIYLMSASGSADRTLNVDKGSFGNTIQHIPAYGSTISEGNVHYAGGATTIYLYSPSSGVNIYAIRVTYGGKETGIDDLYVQPQEEASKILYNGQIFILRGEKEYTIDGRKVR